MDQAIRAAVLAGGCVALACIGAAWVASPYTLAGLPSPHFADATDTVAVRFGRTLYAQRCAPCHGRYLQGQPLWALRDQYAGRRAPAQDQTGHSWEHSDEALFHITKFGRFEAEAAGPASAMPAFGSVLDDHAIVAVIAYIKARWPIGLRVLQAIRNPHREGMPRAAARDWTFPPDCGTAARS